MANAKQEDLVELSKIVAEMKGSLSAWKVFVGGVGSTAVVAGLAALGWCYSLGVTVGKLQQADHEHGIDIVAQLKSPKSTEQLQTNLIKVTAQIQTAEVEGKLPDESKVLPLSDALSGIVKNNPDMPSAWNAAVQLVNYRFQPAAKDISSLPDCLNLPPIGVRPEVPGPAGPDGIPTHQPFKGPAIAQKWESMVVAQNCRLDLDDDGSFASSIAAKDFEDDKQRNLGINYYILEVSNAVVTYSGGKLIPINEIRFKNCSFQIQPSIQVPDKRRQSITQQLLEAKKNDGTIQLPAGI